ncbi:FadR/GntR family transcriptional regulator [Luteimicrobium xylanilyticum]|uniref:Exu regulon transcriptional regulator n=1 Tax=Luteimicrobium xylanilyticum TaxID=1133546 RepID=A0A5P9Q941_9MICO|nr:FCD domain-containing protein [Luteimicrobium xylanilyticum]QFU97796.1 Exu regulon transcriptional regulator [Luteimicrobium xylanilyticum]
MPQVLPNVPLSTQVADQLRHRIADGEFPVGSRIPTEARLTDELGVSRNSVREALRSLVHAGLLRARAGDGTYVTATSELAPALHRELEHARAADVAEVRLVLEREAARLAATRATAEHLGALDDALAAREAAGTGASYAAADLDFHHRLLDASGNLLLGELHRGTGGVEDSLLRTTPLDAEFTTYRVTTRPLDDAHAAVVTAIKARDPERAADAVETMIGLAETLAGRADAAHGPVAGGTR